MFFIHHAPDLVRIILSASSVTARILSLAVLLLSLAPLGSIYVLFFSIGLGNGGGNDSHSDSSPSGDGGITGSSSSSYEDSLAAVLKNPNATLEDLWTAIFDSQMMFPQNLQAKAVLSALNHNDLLWLPTSAHSMHHLRILLPWILSFILGVLIPCFVSILTILRRQRARYGGPRESNPAREKKILSLLAKSLAPYTKILDASDRVDSETTQGPMPPSEENVSVSMWRVPEPGQSTVDGASSTTFRTISGLCGICLDLFTETQSVSWSSNPSCRHCFHDTCIQAWLLRTHRNRNAKQCPCCRQHFLLVKRSKL
jgi:Ring finger domain